MDKNHETEMKANMMHGTPVNSMASADRSVYGDVVIPNQLDTSIIDAINALSDVDEKNKIPKTVDETTVHVLSAFFDTVSDFIRKNIPEPNDNIDHIYVDVTFKDGLSIGKKCFSNK